MNNEKRTGRGDASDVEHLIVPFSAFFGPVYRPLRSAEEVRKRWSSSVTVGMLAVAFLFFIVALVVGIGSSGDDPAYLFEHPVVFWSLIFGVFVVRWLIGAVWVRRHRSSLERVKLPLSLDERLVANHGSARLSAVRVNAILTAMVFLFFLVPALLQMAAYPWIFGPMALMFGVQFWVAFRVYRFRARQTRSAERSGESSATGASSR